MSGGAFNHLCHADHWDIHAKLRDLEEMRDRLIELGYDDAAAETERLIAIIHVTETRTTVLIERLFDVWKSVEWVDSFDSPKHIIEKSIAKYREEQDVRPQKET